MNFEILTGLIIRPDLFSFQHLQSLTAILEEMANLQDSVLLALPIEYDEEFIKFTGHYYARAIYELKTTMAQYNETEFSKSSAIYSSYYEKAELIKSESKIAWAAVERYLIKASKKLSSDSSVFYYNSDIGSFKIEYMIANLLNGTTYTINSANDYKISLPANLFDGSTLTDLSLPIRMFAASWSFSPIILTNEDSYKILSDTLSIHIIDSTGYTIQINGKEISMTMPLLSTGYFDSAELECKAWSLDESKMIDSECSIIMATGSLTSFSNCEECTFLSTVTLEATHLSSFAATEPTNQTVTTTTYDGIDNGRPLPLTTSPVHKSLATICFALLTSIYITGMFIFLKTNKSEAE